MIAEFIFFIGIASICFSGLLFTLWTLGKLLSARSMQTILTAWLLQLDQQNNLRKENINGP